MNETKLTHCPHCHATFKVHDQQLKVAQGKVRCGSCLKVFNALDNLISSEKDYIPVAKETYHPADTFSKPASTIKLTPDSKSLPDRKQTTTPKTKENQKENNTHSMAHEDEFIFQDNPDEDNDKKSHLGKITLPDDYDTNFINLNTNETQSSHQFSDALDDTNTDIDFTPNDEDWALQMLKEEEEPESPSDKKMDFSEEFTNLDNPPEKSPDPKPPTSPPLTHSPLMANKDIDPVTGENILEKNDDSPFNHLFSEPAEYKPFAEKKSFLRKIVWGLINLSLFIALLGQLAWYKYDSLIQYPAAKTVFTKACQILKCQLPELININLIKSQNLVVRSHPTVPHALIIDAIIVNTAGFSQPFPDMALYFSNLNNKVIAQRLFTPNDYLAGEVRSWKNLPPRIPIHISIEIYDPGSAAVNYHVRFFKHRPKLSQKKSALSGITTVP